MRKIAEIRRDLAAKVAEVKALENSAENAGAIDKGLGEIRTLAKELETATAVEAAEQAAADRKLSDDARKGHRFSIRKFFLELSENNLTGVEKDAADMGRDEYRRLGLSQSGHVIPSSVLRAAAGQNYGTAGDGGNLVETMPARYVEALRDKIVVAGLGATVLGDLVGTLPVISASDITAGWLAEGTAGTVSKATVSKATMTPKRSFVAGAVTKDLLRQTSLDIEAMLQEKLIYAHARLLDSAAIAGTGTGNQPTGILSAPGTTTVEIGTNGGAIDWAKVVALETALNDQNAGVGKLAYLTNAKVWGTLKTTEKAGGTARFLLDDNNRLNGHLAQWTNIVPSNLTKGTASSKCSALIFGNFADLFIGQWGGLDIVIDPYTLALNADVRFVLNAWNDVLVAEPKSFAVIKDIVTG